MSIKEGAHLMPLCVSFRARSLACDQLSSRQPRYGGLHMSENGLMTTIKYNRKTLSMNCPADNSCLVSRLLLHTLPFCSRIIQQSTTLAIHPCFPTYTIQTNRHETH